MSQKLHHIIQIFLKIFSGFQSKDQPTDEHRNLKGPGPGQPHYHDATPRRDTLRNEGTWLGSSKEKL